MKENEKTQKLQEELYIYPQKAWKKMRAAQTTAQDVYLCGASGYGKTTLLEHYLKNKEHYYFSVGTIQQEQMEALRQEKDFILALDDLHMAHWQEIQQMVQEMAERKDVWLILSGRSMMPSWLMPTYLKKPFMIIREEELTFSREETREYLRCWELFLPDADQKKLHQVTMGNPMAMRLAVMELAGGKEFDDQLIEQGRNRFWDYLEYHVYDQWDVDLQEFLMEMSIVESFTLELAEMITGRNDVERIVKKALDAGNFLEEKEGAYHIRYTLRVSMQRRLARQWTKEQRNNLYYNAGLFFEMAGRMPEALDMYQKCGNQERISGILIANARKNPSAGYYYELRSYYLSLPEDTVRKSVELMAGMSMLYSMLLEPEESEKWYQNLKEYTEEQSGSKKRYAAGWLVYLDIGLPHRGIKNLTEILKHAGTLLLSRRITLPEFSVTSNLPSLMNGGKDFCQWTKKDVYLASTIGKIVETVLGKFGKGLVNIALAESFFEKGGNNYEVSVRAGRGRMQAEAGGKTELVFVAVGILIKLHILEHHLEEAAELLESFRHAAAQNGMDKLLPNIDTMRCRIALYLGDREAADKWMRQAPGDGQNFFSLERYHYLTKVRIYLSQGKNASAINLIQRLFYYAEILERTYIKMEASLLLAIARYRMEESDWESILQEVLREAEDYHFVRIISQEGAAVWPLLKAGSWEIKDKSFLDQVLRETEDMALTYPSYLKARGDGEPVFSENALKILRLQAEGMSQAEIAAELGIKENTVKYHSKQTYKKLGVNSKTAAVTEARKRRLI